MNKKLPSQASLLKDHREKLDQKFLQDYPDGRFCIQYRGDMGLEAAGQSFWCLHWAPRRNAGAWKRRGISTSNQGGKINQQTYQNNSFGKCWNYDNYLSFCTAVMKKKVPYDLVCAFQLRYGYRAGEGFITTKDNETKDDQRNE